MTVNAIFVPRAERHDCTIIVRGGVHQAMFTSTKDFDDWLAYEGLTHKSWNGDPFGYSTCLIYAPNGTANQRAEAHRIDHYRNNLID